MDQRTVCYDVEAACGVYPMFCGTATAVQAAARYISGSWAGTISERYHPREIWPRTDAEKVRRMTRFMEWKVEQMNARRQRVLLTWAGFAALSVAVPCFVAVLSYAWRWAVLSIFQ